MSETKQLLTHSRIQAFKRCRKAHYFGYELCIRPEEESKALRMGSAYHEGQEIVGKGGSLDDAVERIRQFYLDAPDAYDQWERDIEQETVVRLLCGYVWRWQESGVELFANPDGSKAAEQEFYLPLLNPETGRSTPIWDMAGKIDGIVRLQDQRLAVRDFKLVGEDIGPDSKLRPRLRMDSQISLYVNAARRVGYDVDTVLYDLTRKPTIKPTPVPILDEHKQKIVLDPNRERIYNKNGSPRQTGDTEKGYEIQQRQMTSDEWGEKLNDDIALRPDFYYQRIEVPRLENQLAEFDRELWQIQLTIRDAQKSGDWFRTVDLNTCGFCPYFSICDNAGINLDGPLPEGFVRLDNPHQELKNANRNTAPATEESTAPACESAAASCGSGF